MLNDRLAFGAMPQPACITRIEDRSPATGLFAASVVVLKA